MDIEQRNKYLLKSLPIINEELQVFVNKYKVRQFLSKEDIEDMHSECIVTVANIIPNFDSSRGFKLKTYISHRIKGFFKDYLRKLSREKKLINRYLFDFYKDNIIEKIHEVVQLDNEQAIIFFEQNNLNINSIVLSKQVHELIQSLPENKVYVLLCFYMLDRSVQNIAEDLNLSTKSGWVYKLKNQAIKILQDELSEKGVLNGNLS